MIESTFTNFSTTFERAKKTRVELSEQVACCDTLKKIFDRKHVLKVTIQAVIDELEVIIKSLEVKILDQERYLTTVASEIA